MNLCFFFQLRKVKNYFSIYKLFLKKIKKPPKLSFGGYLFVSDYTNYASVLIAYIPPTFSHLL